MLGLSLACRQKPYSPKSLSLAIRGYLGFPSAKSCVWCLPWLGTQERCCWLGHSMCPVRWFLSPSWVAPCCQWDEVHIPRIAGPMHPCPPQRQPSACTPALCHIELLQTLYFAALAFEDFADLPGMFLPPLLNTPTQAHCLVNSYLLTQVLTWLSPPPGSIPGLPKLL